MTLLRLTAFTLFAAFSGLVIVGVLRLQSVALLFYCAGLVYFALDYRKLKGSGEKAVAYQSEIEARTKDLPFGCSKKDYAKILVMGMCACLLLILITALDIGRHAK